MGHQAQGAIRCLGISRIREIVGNGCAYLLVVVKQIYLSELVKQQHACISCRRPLWLSSVQ